VIDITNFTYASGDMSIATTSVPTIKQGQSITFNNLDAHARNGICTTITDCAEPCDGHTVSRTRLPTEDRFDSLSSGPAARPRRVA